MKNTMMKLLGYLLSLIVFLGLSSSVLAEEKVGLDDKLNTVLEPVSKTASEVIFFSVGNLLGQEEPEGLMGAPVVLLLLAITAAFLTIYFRFINLRAFGLALKTVKGRYSKKDDPGQINHFQALTTALSATVGLGNIAGVAVAIGLGGPGAVFWMIVMGFLGMTSKFTECTLGVRYRKIDENGQVQGGGMRYLEYGLGERGFGKLGKALAIFFAIACVGGAIGAGNMFQINQSAQQVSETFGVFTESKWIFGAIVAALVGGVIIGGIVSIARVTAFLVPFMTIIYVIACIVVLGANAGQIPAALGTIVSEAFSGNALGGGFIGALIQGIKRGVFSNEAGLGSAAIAHAPVKTRKPASEGVVALLEPFIDTVVVCLMTALVVVVTGTWKVDSSIGKSADLVVSTDANAEVVQSLKINDVTKVLKKWSLVKAGNLQGYVDSAVIKEGRIIEKTDLLAIPEADSKAQSKLEKGSVEVLGEWAFVQLKDGETKGYVLQDAVIDRTGWGGGIWLTSRSFAAVISWFPYVLTIAVVLFAFSTMISWSFYGEQAIGYLTGGNRMAITIYKVVFCLSTVVGAGASLQAVLDLSDAMYFAMVFPNLIGLYFLLPIVKKELVEFQRFSKRVDEGATLDEAEKAE